VHDVVPVIAEPGKALNHLPCLRRVAGQQLVRRHPWVCRRAVPVPLISGGVDDVAGADFFDLAAAAGLVQAFAFGDVEGLAGGVGVPGRADGRVDRPALNRTCDGSSLPAMPSIQRPRSLAA
jgi:hypothetical protein